VDQVVLPGPEHERDYLGALSDRLARAAAVVSYNGASFDLPLLRTRFALHGLDDPLAGVPHLDLLPLARRLWRERLPDCRLGTIEQHVLGARRSARDVPGAEVPARYRAFLRSRDALPLRGVLEHNRDDVVALSALRSLLEARSVPGGGHDPDEALAWARWLEATGDPVAALAHLNAIEATDVEAAWHAGRLLRRAGRTGEALTRWRRLADAGDPRGWIELAKHHEHRGGDLAAALEATETAARLGGAAHDDLERRRTRLRARLGRSDV
jgi:DNA polymerase III epsilon subunit-like protein